MKLVSLKYTKTEAKEEAAEMSMPAARDYSYGLTLRLEDEELQKLGLLDTLPAVKSTLRFACEGTVTDVSVQRRAEQDDETCVSIQITAMAVLPAEAGQAAATPASKARAPTVLDRY